jgi:hypothetical protein
MSIFRNLATVCPSVLLVTALPGSARAGDRTLPSPCPGVLITEIMYNPSTEQGSDFTNEWVEIRNESCEDVDLRGWTIEDESGNAPDPLVALDGFPPVLAPAQFALIVDGTGSEVIGNPVWEIAPDARIFGTDDAAIGNGLSNAGDTIFIRDASAMLVTAVRYDDTDDSGCGNEADGGGYSLERVDPLGPGTCANFRSQELADEGFPEGGTPGSENFLWAGSVCECVTCEETVNPHGRNVPRAGQRSPGRNEDGFYRLGSTFDPSVDLFVTDDLGSGPFGPFASGDAVKITEAPGARPGAKPMGSARGQAGAVAAHVTLRSDARIFAIDPSGNRTEAACLVPPPPK